ncbi:hypothetical protein T265_11117 [Opisthorchis viverrini]|uniref:Uncharacterized protein n=1 Tax=Opisthorchis viverrini TaxID=6198 RepID=A0A074ZYQ2_OPIVI|nr:hypothetical protein T265_11117 [Opisthorchis viverrini]KER20309.1 hypothetical protein T265_11117 [Opisthorchis viverrini]
MAKNSVFVARQNADNPESKELLFSKSPQINPQADQIWLRKFDQVWCTSVVKTRKIGTNNTQITGMKSSRIVAKLWSEPGKNHVYFTFKNR